MASNYSTDFPGKVPQARVGISPLINWASNYA